MSTLLIKTNEGGQATLAPEDLDALRAQLRGTVCLPGEPGYDDARTIWNAMIDRRPALIVRASAPPTSSPRSTSRARRTARLAVKGGGHNIAGNAVLRGRADDRPLADEVRRASTRPPAPRAWSPARCSPSSTRRRRRSAWRRPLGINSTTGIAGLTLGGGFGWLSRKHRPHRSTT